MEQADPNKVLALQTAAADSTKTPDEVVTAAEKYLAFLNK